MATQPAEPNLYDRFQTFVYGAGAFLLFAVILGALLFLRGCFAGEQTFSNPENARLRAEKAQAIHAAQAETLEKIGLGEDPDVAATTLDAALKAVAGRGEPRPSSIAVPVIPAAAPDEAEADATDADADAGSEESDGSGENPPATDEAGKEETDEAGKEETDEAGKEETDEAGKEETNEAGKEES